MREDVLASAVLLPKKLPWYIPPPIFLKKSYIIDHRSKHVLAASGIAMVPPLLSVSTSSHLAPVPSEPPHQHCSNQKQDDGSSSKEQANDTGSSSSSTGAGEHKGPAANPVPRKKATASAVDSSTAAVTTMTTGT